MSALSPQQIHGQRHSGYRGSVAHWQRFLTCWAAASSGAYYFHPRPQNIVTGALRETEVVDAAIAERETALRVRLPQSYVDFLRVYRTDAGWLADAELFHVSRIALFKDVSPDWDQEIAEREAREPAVDVSAERYYVYGQGQDVLAYRESQIREMIVIGSWGSNSSQLVLLNPAVMTADGEMETWLFGIYVARTVSFAEAMRQLSYLETQDPSSEPLYSQDELRGSCADLLPVNPWWK